MQQPGQRVRPQPPPRRRTGLEGGPVGRIGSAARRSASTAKPAASATVSPARPARASASSIAAHNAWPTAIPVPSRPDRTTGHPARLPARRSSRSQARDAVLLCSDCIVAPISSDDTRRTGRQLKCRQWSRLPPRPRLADDLSYHGNRDHPYVEDASVAAPGARRARRGDRRGARQTSCREVGAISSSRVVARACTTQSCLIVSHLLDIERA